MGPGSVLSAVGVGGVAGVGDGSGVGVKGGTGVGDGTTGVDRSEFGEGVWGGVSEETGLESAALVSVALDGLKLSTATTRESLPLVSAENAAHAPTHITIKTTRNATADPLLCIDAFGALRPQRDCPIDRSRSLQTDLSYCAGLRKASRARACAPKHGVV